jgi:hypothetical protein
LKIIDTFETYQWAVIVEKESKRVVTGMKKAVARKECLQAEMASAVGKDLELARRT